MDNYKVRYVMLISNKIDKILFNHPEFSKYNKNYTLNIMAY